MTSSVEVYVDGSWSDPLTSYSYGAVVLVDGKVVETIKGKGNDPRFTESRQIAGECFGSIAGIYWAIENNYKEVTIYYDYLGIEMWAIGKWKRRKPVSQTYKQFYDQLTPLIGVTFTKVKAHSGVEHNELADKLAKEALGIGKR